MATSTLVSLEEYLRTDYRPDVEYIDGELREKPGYGWIHNRLQALLAGWFGSREDEWEIESALNVRVRVSPSRVRLADFTAIRAGSSPEAALVDPPLLVIEIVSPGESPTEVDERICDYSALGVPNVWVIDPQQKIARERRGDAWVDVTRLTVADGSISIDVVALLARPDRYKFIRNLHC